MSRSSNVCIWRRTDGDGRQSLAVRSSNRTQMSGSKRMELEMLKIREIRSESGIIPRLAVRWLMIALATIFAFWPTWTKLWQSTASGTAIGYVFALRSCAWLQPSEQT